MQRKWLPTLVFGMSLGIIGCGSSSSGPDGSGGVPGATGGKGSGGSSTGGSSTGGASTGGSATGGKGTGGSASGGTATGGASSGGSASGGTTTGGAAGGSATGGKGGAATGGGGGTASGGSPGSGGAGGSGDKSAPAPSKGCGMADGAKMLTMGGSSVMGALATSTRLKITSGGMNREYIIDIPADYDPTHPYRLIFSWYQAYGSDTGNANGLHPADDGMNFDANNYAFYGLRREATNAKQPAIFVAPGGMGDLPWDFTRDLPFFDDLLAKIDANLCIDDNRVFSTGFSFGAMMTYALSITRQTKLRGVVAMAPANYALPGEPKDSNAAPIAYMGTTGMSDGRCPWVNDDGKKEGGKYCALTHAQDNGCDTTAAIQTTTAGSKKYVCYDFNGCKVGYPVKVCTFDGPHTPSSIDDGSTTKDDGAKAFIPPIAWKFISQF